MQLWTMEHTATLLPAVAVMIVITAVLRRTIGSKPYHIRMIPFQILACIIVLLEIGKQACSLHNGYNLYHLPFHLCSLFIFLLPLMSFYQGKHRDTVCTVTTAVTTATTLLTLIYPSLIYSAWDITSFGENFLSFHTVVFHNIVIFEFFIILGLDLCTPQKPTHKTIPLFMLCFCIISATMAQLLKTNYNNFYSCNVAPLESLRLSLQGTIGYIPTQCLYIMIVSVLDILFVSASFSLYRLLHRLFNSRSTEKEMCQEH